MLLVTTPLFPSTLLRSVINSGVPTQAEYVTVVHQCTGMHVVPHHDTDLYR